MCGPFPVCAKRLGLAPNQFQTDIARKSAGIIQDLGGQREVVGLQVPLPEQIDFRRILAQCFRPMVFQIIPIGTWVMAEACRQLKLWSAAPQTQDLTLSVNVSILQFHQPGYVAEVREIMEQSGANPARLMIEDVQGTVQKLTALKALGIAIAMDDFGTGYSSLSSLTLFPLDQLKIDQSFVVNLPQGHHDAILANTIIQMGTSLGMGVIAEGVETEAQWDFLMENGCRDFQGYLFKPPMPLGFFEECINAQCAL